MAETEPKLLIKNGTIVNDDHMFASDVYIENGIIKEIGPNLSIDGQVRVIDANEKLVIPGGIDPHVHLQLPFMGTTTVDDFYTGTRAALAGGTTMIIDFAATPRGKSLIDTFNSWKGWAEEKACCDYAFSVIVTYWNDNVRDEMTKLVKDEGVNSFKFFMAYVDNIIRDGDMLEAFYHCKELGALARVHAENGDVIFKKEKELLALGITGPEGHRQARPEEVEAEATNRACVLAGQANVPLYVVHVNCKGAAKAVLDHRVQGANVIGETLAAGLGANGTHYFNKCWRHAAGFVCAPPLSTDPSTPDYFADLLACNGMQLTGSDNCTFSSHQKAMGKDDFSKIPNGINGIEDRMSVVWEKCVHTGKMDASRFVAITSSTAAKIFNIYPQKGRVAVGSDADLVIWDPNATRTISVKTHHQAVDFNIFEGMSCHGVASVTISRGRVVWENGNLHVNKASGQFVPLKPWAPFIYNVQQQREKVRKPIKIEREPYVQAKP